MGISLWASFDFQAPAGPGFHHPCTRQVILMQDAPAQQIVPESWALEDWQLSLLDPGVWMLLAHWTLQYCSIPAEMRLDKHSPYPGYFRLLAGKDKYRSHHRWQQDV
jgi:hypothetical protein